MKKNLSLIYLLILPCLGFFVGCASPAQPKAMIAQKVPQVQTPRDGVVVVVSGGSKTDPMWRSKIAGADFQAAILESLRKSALFRSAETNGSAPYRLEVRLEILDQPTIGFNMTVTMRADWKLLQSADNREIWHERIVSRFTATVGDAFAAVARVRVANEGAARKNIEEALEKMAAVEVKETAAKTNP